MSRARPRPLALLLLASLLAGATFAPGSAVAASPSKRTTNNHSAARSGRKAPAPAAKPGSHGRGRAIAHKSPTRGTRKSPTAAAASERRVPAVRAGLPNVQALGALVLDENGHELYARRPDHERPIASISKLAATLAVMDRGLELEGLSTIARTDIEVARGGARSRLLEGLTLSNRDLLHAALMGSDNRAIPALGRAVKLSPSQLAAAMTAKAKELGLTHTRFHDPTGLSIENVSTPRETIVLLQAVMHHPVLGPITRRLEYDAHPIGRPPIRYVNTYRPAVRSNVQVMGGKTGYNDDARYCLVLAAKIDGHTCYMSFLGNEGKLTRFGDVARVADWVVSRKPQTQTSTLLASTSTAESGDGVKAPRPPSAATAPVLAAGTNADRRPPQTQPAPFQVATTPAQTSAVPAADSSSEPPAPAAASQEPAASSLVSAPPLSPDLAIPIESVAR